ncbi:sulfate ABC transporter permease subunit CysT [Desmospora profundinema]|uniref:Sulfate transport system permease protein CysT n=1 Tax=Desmospora profundinema TaxID=1571184 RepID=A0ABU1IJX6_9BACL|nr:sulfate ABC transporter permease subunit CysT [Desmospora profundinema]MDR6224454.1 sulfate transport system permease protein [Desmospora profundinema]
MNQKSWRISPLPGFGPAMGFTLLYVTLIVLIPLSAIFVITASLGWSDFWSVVTEPRVVASYRLSLLTALAAAGINVIFGVLVAWVLVRYRFPGKKLMDGLVDLPFALPTAVAGIALTSLYTSNGWLGRWLDPFGIQVAFTPIGITVALVFIGLPFVVRTVQPVLQSISREVEEAALSLGATPRQTFFRVILPELFPAVVTGFVLAFSRALGEYGSVVFISGNMPLKTEIAPLIIMTKLEQFDYTGAAAVALVMLSISFVLLIIINGFQTLQEQRKSRWKGAQ